MKLFNATVTIHIDEVPNDLLFAECAERITGIMKSATEKKIKPQTAKRYANMFLKIQNAINPTDKLTKLHKDSPFIF